MECKPLEIREPRQAEDRWIDKPYLERLGTSNWT